MIANTRGWVKDSALAAKSLDLSRQFEVPRTEMLPATAAVELLPATAAVELLPAAEMLPAGAAEVDPLEGAKRSTTTTTATTLMTLACRQSKRSHR